HDLVEQQLRVAVDVERRLVLGRLDEVAAAPVYRRRGGVDERDTLHERMLEQLERVAIVVRHHVAAIAFHRVGAGALVEDGAHALQAAEPREELLLVEVVGDVATHQVAELGGRAQVVDRDDLELPARVERRHEMRADEARGAGDDDHSPNNSCGVTSAVPSLPTTMPPAVLARPTATSMAQPTASAVASVATTVSPAPDTS